MVRPLWEEIEKLIIVKVGKRVTLGMKEVMLGIGKMRGFKKQIIDWINHLILTTKMVISKIKYGPGTYPLGLLRNELRIRKLTIQE